MPRSEIQPLPRWLKRNVPKGNANHFTARLVEELGLETVCDHARESCPVFFGGGVKRHQGFPDPSAALGTDTEVLAVFRQVRDEIRQWIEETY